MIKHFISAAILATLASSAMAATPNTFYAGVDGGSTKIDGLGDREGSIGAFVGYNFHPFFAAELGARRLGSWDVIGTSLDINQYAVSVVGTYPLQNKFSVFGRLGYNKIEGETDNQGFTAEASDSGAVYGVGVGYAFTPTITGRIEFQKPASNASNISAGVVFAF